MKIYLWKFTIITKHVSTLVEQKENMVKHGLKMIKHVKFASAMKKGLSSVHWNAVRTILKTKKDTK